MEKKNSKMILNIMVLIIGILLGYLGSNLINNYLNKTDNTSVNNSDSEKLNNNSFDSKLDKGKVNYYDYIYSFPDDVSFLKEVTDNSEIIKVFNNKDGWAGTIELFAKDGYEDGFFGNYDNIEKRLRDNTLRDIKNRKVTKFGDKEVVSFEGYGDTTNGLFAYMPAYDNYEFEIVLFDSNDKTINYKALDTVIDILVNGVKTK